MQVQTTREPERLTRDRGRRLGWLSLALGGALLGFPDVVAEVIGLSSDGNGEKRALRAIGLREIGSGLGIFARPRSGTFVWGRVLGDVMDLALLGNAARSSRNEAPRLGAAAALVGGLALYDAWIAAKLTGIEPHSDAGRRRKQIQRSAAVTITGSQERIEAAWAKIAHDDFKGALSFRPAPGNRGVEVRMTHGRFGGRLAEGRLRRLKQIVEVGEPIVSDATKGDLLR